VRHLEAAALGPASRYLRRARCSRASQALAFDRAAEFLRVSLRLGTTALTICTAAGKRSLPRSQRRTRRRGRRRLLRRAKGASRTGSQGAEDQLELTHQAARQLLGKRTRRARLDSCALYSLSWESPFRRRRATLSGLLSKPRVLNKAWLAFTPRRVKQVERRQLILLDVFGSVALGLSFVVNVRALTSDQQACEWLNRRRALARRALYMIEAIYVAQRAATYQHARKPSGGLSHLASASYAHRAATSAGSMKTLAKTRTAGL